MLRILGKREEVRYRVDAEERKAFRRQVRVENSGECRAFGPRQF